MTTFTEYLSKKSTNRQDRIFKFLEFLEENPNEKFRKADLWEALGSGERIKKIPTEKGYVRSEEIKHEGVYNHETQLHRDIDDLLEMSILIKVRRGRRKRKWLRINPKAISIVEKEIARARCHHTLDECDVKEIEDGIHMATFGIPENIIDLSLRKKLVEFQASLFQAEHQLSEPFIIMYTPPQSELKAASPTGKFISGSMSPEKIKQIYRRQRRIIKEEIKKSLTFSKDITCWFKRMD